MQSTDWSKTPLGPPAMWPSSLRTVLRLMLTSRYAMWLGWGPDLLFFYNDAYREQTLGAKHPAALGAPVSEVWAEIWDDLAPRIHASHRPRARPPGTRGSCSFLERNGYSEETYHTFSYSPAPSDTGGIGGLFCVVIEETRAGARPSVAPRSCASSRPPSARRRRRAHVLAAMEQCLDEGRPRHPVLAHVPVRRRRQERALGFADGHRGGASRQPDRSSGSTTPGDLAARRRVGRAARRRGSTPFRDRIADGRGRKSPSSRSWCRLRRPATRAQQGRLLPASIPIARSTTTYRSFIELFVGQLAAGPRERARVRNGEEASGGARAARSRQDGVLLECKPRVPDAAHADARARPRMRWHRQSARFAERSSRSSIATSFGCSSSSTRCSISRAWRRGAFKRRTCRRISRS